MIKTAWRRAARFFGSGILFAAVLVVLVLVIGSGIVIGIAEVGVNENVDSVIDGFAWVTITIITGPPWATESPAGRLVYYLMALVRPGLFALVTAAIASRLVQFVLRRNSGLGRARVKDHIVIAGWSSKGAEIIDEIRGRHDAASESEIVVIAPLAQNPTRDPLTTFINGDPTKTEDLERAAIKDARTAIVIADNSYPDIDVEDMDSRTLIAVLAIESLNPDCYTCVEVINSHNREHFERTRANELLVTGRLTGALLAHSAVTQGLSKVLGDLITHPTGNEFYWVELPQDMAGQAFHEIMSKLKRDHEIVPVALSTADGFVTNPPSEYVLSPGDRALVIAEKQPSLV